jgi:hypothetical protein
MNELTTYVVLQNNPAFDQILKQAIDKYWKHSPYKYIYADELQEYLKRKNAAFITPLQIEIREESDHGPYTAVYYYFAWIQGGRKKLIKYKHNDMLAYAVIDYEGKENRIQELIYRIDHIIAMISHVPDIVREQNIGGNYIRIMARLQNYYSDNAGVLKTKTLLIDRDYLNPALSEEDIRKVYPFKYLLVSGDFISNAIRNKDAEYAYLLRAISRNMHVIVVDAKNADVLFADITPLEKTLKKRNIKKISQQIIKLN